MAGAVLIEGVDADMTSDPFISNGGQYIVVIRADEFGPGIVAIQYSPRPLEDEAEARWRTIQNGIYTTDAEVRLDYVPNGDGIRAVLSDAGVSPAGTTDNVFVEIKQ